MVVISLQQHGPIPPGVYGTRIGRYRIVFVFKRCCMYLDPYPHGSALIWHAWSRIWNGALLDVRLGVC
jgi:hypothetical protein